MSSSGSPSRSSTVMYGERNAASIVAAVGSFAVGLYGWFLCPMPGRPAIAAPFLCRANAVTCWRLHARRVVRLHVVRRVFLDARLAQPSDRSTANDTRASPCATERYEVNFLAKQIFGEAGASTRRALVV